MKEISIKAFLSLDSGSQVRFGIQDDLGICCTRNAFSLYNPSIRAKINFTSLYIIG